MKENKKDLNIKFNTQLGEADEATVDKWELIASRRALQNLRTLLYGEEMHKLIKKQIDENDRRIKQYLEQSHGKFREVFVEVDVEGISATEYVKWQSNAMKDAITGNDKARKDVVTNIVFPAHPEHYMLLESGVVETLGGLPTNATVARAKDIPQFVLDAGNPDYPDQSYSCVKLADGTIWSYGLTEYRDTDKGAQMRLHVWWPASCPEIFFEDHARHFAVEYRNFIHMAVEDIKSNRN